MRALLVLLVVLPAVLVAPVAARAACPPAAPSTIEAVAATGGPARVLAAQRTCSGGFADPGVSRDGAAVHAVSWRLRRGQPVAAVVHLPSRRTVGLPDRSVDPLLGPDGVHVAALEPAGVGLALVVRAVATGREVARVVHSGDPAFLDDFGIDRPSRGRRTGAASPCCSPVCAATS